MPILETQPFQLPDKPPVKNLRLAHIVYYKAKVNSIDAEVEIWIDAEDEEFLGASFPAY